MLSDKRRRVPGDMASMLAMDTSSLETTAALAIDLFKAVCWSMLKAVMDMGIERTISTTNILVDGDEDGDGEDCDDADGED